MMVKSNLDENELCLVVGSYFEQNQHNWLMIFRRWVCKKRAGNFSIKKKKRRQIDNVRWVTVQLVKQDSANPHISEAGRRPVSGIQFCERLRTA